MYTIFFLLSFTHLTFSRGPHHPRGESVAKHHVHYRPTREDHANKITQDSQLLHDKEHIREDIGDWIKHKAIEEMSDEELEFHYFNIHDSDKNEHLDGLEILQAMRHTGDDDENADDFNFFVDLIDEVLLKDDKNDDGMISYPEYVAAKKKENQIMNLVNKVSL